MKLYQPLTLVVVVSSTLVERFLSLIVQPERPGSPLLAPLPLRSLYLTPQTGGLSRLGDQFIAEVLVGLAAGKSNRKLRCSGRRPAELRELAYLVDSREELLEAIGSCGIGLGLGQDYVMDWTANRPHKGQGHLPVGNSRLAGVLHSISVQIVELDSGYGGRAGYGNGRYNHMISL